MRRFIPPEWLFVLVVIVAVIVGLVFQRSLDIW